MAAVHAHRPMLAASATALHAPGLPDAALHCIASFLPKADRYALSVTCFKCLQLAPNPDHTFIHFRVSSPAAGVTSFIDELTNYPHVHELVGAWLLCGSDGLPAALLPLCVRDSG